MVDDIRTTSFLQTAEHLASNALREGMNSNLDYKDIYKLCKSRLIEFADTAGVSAILSYEQNFKIASNG